MKQRCGLSIAMLRTVFPLVFTVLAGLAVAPPAADAIGWIRLLAPRDKNNAISIALDSGNNMYVCGLANQVGDEGGPDNIIIAKYGSEVRQSWKNHFGDSNNDQCIDVALDADGNVFAAALSADDKGRKIVVARYSGTGEEQGHGEYRIEKSAEVRGISHDGNGGVYVTGFHPSEENGGKNPFVAKYDAAGSQVWRRLIPKPTGSNGEAHAAAADDTGVYVTGWVGAAAGTAGAGKSAFIAKYSAAGYFGWMKIFGGKGDVEGNAVVIGPQDGLIMVGTASGGLPGNRGFGHADAFLVKYSKNGEQGQAAMFGTADNDYGYGAMFDGAGGIYLGGSSRASFKGKESADSFELFLARYTPDGTSATAETPGLAFATPGGLLSPAFSGRITLNTGSRVSIYGTSAENYIGGGQWSVRRWLAGPESMAVEKEKAGEAPKESALASFRMEVTSFLARDAGDVGYANNLLGKTVIVAGSILALAGLLLLL